jgi:Zn-dependent oligopeptidase
LLDEEKQKELKKISFKLSELTTHFSNNVLDSQNEYKYTITNKEIIKNLPENVLKRVEKKNAS